MFIVKDCYASQMEWPDIDVWLDGVFTYKLEVKTRPASSFNLNEVSYIKPVLQKKLPVSSALPQSYSDQFSSWLRCLRQPRTRGSEMK